MSTRKGEAKKSQKYHNKTAYEVKFNTKLLEANAKAPLDHLCGRCMEQIKWKIQYGKYKPKTSLSRCNICQDKNISKAYRTVCDKCANDQKLCSKCGKAKEIADAPKPEKKLDRNGVDRDKLKQMEDYMEELRERSKRNMMRRLMKGEVDFVDGHFVEVETGEPIKNLRFKGDIDEMEDNWEEDDEDDDEDDLDDDEDGEGDEEGNKEEQKVDEKKEEDVAKKDSDKKESAPEKVADKKQANDKKGNNKAANKQKAQQKKKKESDDDDDFDDDDFGDDEDF